MKKYTTIFFLALALNSNAQPTQFTYDAAGNRVQRSMLPALIIANGNNQSDSSNTEQATLAGYNMTLYPNTTEDMVYISVDKAFLEVPNKEIRVFDMQGMEVARKLLANEEETIQLGNLAPGIYLVRIIGEG